MPFQKLPLSAVPLPQKYRALEARFELMEGYDGSCAFVLAIDPDTFLEVPGVGRGKLIKLRELQGELPSLIEKHLRDAAMESPDNAIEAEPSPLALTEDDAETPLELLPVSVEARVILEHLRRMPDFDGTCGAVMRLRPAAFAKLRSVGRGKVEQLKAVQQAIPVQLQQVRASRQQLNSASVEGNLDRLDETLCVELSDFLTSLARFGPT